MRPSESTAMAAAGHGHAGPCKPLVPRLRRGSPSEPGGRELW